MRRHLSIVVLPPVLVFYLAAGAAGLYGYIDNYWLYRGFGPPRDPAFVKERGTTEQISVTSAALGGRTQTVYVYLPPGYADHPNRRYPVLYLLHGFPGHPQGAFLWTNQIGVDEDVLVAEHRANPTILVMPSGSTSFFADNEWANGIRPGQGWETFVARGVVHAIDAHYRTIRSGRGRALGGLSAGGYGALNIGLHHPGEFDVLESWSGYVLADRVKSAFDDDAQLMRRNSPLLTLPAAARALRRAGTFVWLYIGNDDHLTGANRQFDAGLRRAGIRHRFDVYEGGHDWALWRAQTPHALIVASDHLAAHG